MGGFIRLEFGFVFEPKCLSGLRVCYLLRMTMGLLYGNINVYLNWAVCKRGGSGNRMSTRSLVVHA